MSSPFQNGSSISHIYVIDNRSKWQQLVKICLEMHLLLLLLGEKSADWSVQEIASLKEVELENEQVAGNNTTELGDKVTSSLSRSA